MTTAIQLLKSSAALVTPTKAGGQTATSDRDSGLRRNDGEKR